MWKEFFDFDFCVDSKFLILKFIVFGKCFGQKFIGYVGVVNVGINIIWFGFYLVMFNFYVYGKFVWDLE